MYGGCVLTSWSLAIVLPLSKSLSLLCVGFCVPANEDRAVMGVRITGKGFSVYETRLRPIPTPPLPKSSKKRAVPKRYKKEVLK